MRLGGKAALQVGAASDKVRGVFARLPFSWNALAAIVLGVMLAKWTWVLFAPREMAVVAAMQQGAAVEAENLFGVAADPAMNAQFAALPNVRLAGVFAGSPGFAILELDGNKQVGVALGGEVARGVKLREIAADHVVIEGGGGRQRVDLEKKGAADGVVAVPAAAAPATAMPDMSAKSVAGVPQPAGVMPINADSLSPEQREVLGRQIMGGAPR